VNDQASLNYLTNTHRPGDTVTVQFVRNGQTRTERLTVATPAADPPRDQRTLAGRSPMQGATVVNLSPATASQYGLDPFLHGVLVTDAGQGVAGQAGFQAGDIIRGVNGRPVSTTADLASALSSGYGGWRVTIQRGDQQITAQF
jgi:S1-C subfamily serine protease